MKACPETYKDINKYFQHTYIVVPEVDPHKVFQLRQCGPSGIAVVDMEDGSEGLIDFADGFSYTIQSPLTLRRSWFTHKGKSYFIERIPARMWRKGICPENTAIYLFSQATGELSGSEVTSDKLNSFLKFTPATEFPAQSTTPFIIDGKFAVLGQKHILYLWDCPIGRYAPRTKELFICREMSNLPLPSLLSSLKVHYV